MNPKEKAKEIYDKFYSIQLQDAVKIIREYNLPHDSVMTQREITLKSVKQSALLHVGEILKLDLVQRLMRYGPNYVNLHEYYQQVKEELQKL